jgi:hypothetical protein
LVFGSGKQMYLVFARVVNLLMSASRELEHSQEAAKTSIQQAASILHAQLRCSGVERQGSNQELMAWKVRLVESYVEKHIDRPIPVAVCDSASFAAATADRRRDGGSLSPYHPRRQRRFNRRDRRLPDYADEPLRYRVGHPLASEPLPVQPVPAPCKVPSSVLAARRSAVRNPSVNRA